MSFGISAVGWLAGAAIAGTAYTIYSGERMAGAQRDANQKAEAAARLAASQQEQAMNKANAKIPDIAAILQGNLTSGSAGSGSTLLTGPGGIDKNKLLLGKTDLLGGG
jgi:hypothetical protein